MCDCATCGKWAPCPLGSACPNDECPECRELREQREEDIAEDIDDGRVLRTYRPER